MICRQARLVCAGSRFLLTPPIPQPCQPRNSNKSPQRFIHRNRHPDPLSWPMHSNPTPYEIFNITKDTAYTKSRFYELVKLYHPDKHRHHNRLHDLSPDVRIERYRLVVLANNILSDPVKRKAYDLCGAGWSQRPLSNESFKEWRAREDTAAFNATWEDWERWRDARNGKKQEPVYMSHGSFATLIVVFISIGVIGQAHRADARTKERLKLFQDQQQQLTGDLGKRSGATTGRDARVDRFIRERENALWPYQPEKWDVNQTRPDQSDATPTR